MQKVFSVSLLFVLEMSKRLNAEVVDARFNLIFNKSEDRVVLAEKTFLSLLRCTVYCLTLKDCQGFSFDCRDIIITNGITCIFHGQPSVNVISQEKSDQTICYAAHVSISSSINTKEMNTETPAVVSTGRTFPVTPSTASGPDYSGVRHSRNSG